MLGMLSWAVAAAQPSSTAAGPSITIDDFVRFRCGAGGEESTMTWTGRMYSTVPQEKQRTLFGLTGMNVARCFQDEHGNWYMSSRELMYYTDPEDFTKPLKTWMNPWTMETVNVAHVANSPVQAAFGPGSGVMPVAHLAGGAIVAQSSDVLLYYPNPLHGNETFAAYAPQQMYEGGEYFKFMITAESLASTVPAILQTWFAWERQSQWLPWMKMGNRPGGLFSSTTGSRVPSIESLPHFVQDDIRRRLPLYAQAPPCYLDQEDSTSWTYFRDHFDDYLAGAEFPVPAPNASVPCMPLGRAFG